MGGHHGIEPSGPPDRLPAKAAGVDLAPARGRRVHPPQVATGRPHRRAAGTAPNLLVNDHYHIHHDKTIIVDGHTVETGSFNFAPSAEAMNSENVVVIRGMPDVARQYLAHWQSRWDQGQPHQHAP